jgi:hypothetical protein
VQPMVQPRPRDSTSWAERPGHAMRGAAQPMPLRVLQLVCCWWGAAGEAQPPHDGAAKRPGEHTAHHPLSSLHSLSRAHVAQPMEPPCRTAHGAARPRRRNAAHGGATRCCMCSPWTEGCTALDAVKGLRAHLLTGPRDCARRTEGPSNQVRASPAGGEPQVHLRPLPAGRPARPPPRLLPPRLPVLTLPYPPCPYALTVTPQNPALTPDVTLVNPPTAQNHAGPVCAIRLRRPPAPADSSSA